MARGICTKIIDLCTKYSKITVEDTTLIQKAIADITTLDNNQRVFADVNGDGIVSVFDVTLIQKYIVGGYSNTGNVGKPANI